MIENLLTVKDLQDRLNVSRSMAWKLVYSGEIPHVKIGRCVRLRVADIEAFLNMQFMSAGSESRSLQ